MELSAASANAGNTTTMADRAAAAFEQIGTRQNIYRSAFTNNAVSRIEENLLERYDELSPNIKTSARHSFLYLEIIKRRETLAVCHDYHVKNSSWILKSCFCDKAMRASRDTPRGVSPVLGRVCANLL